MAQYAEDTVARQLLSLLHPYPPHPCPPSVPPPPMNTPGNYIFDATVTRVNLALVMQALRNAPDPPAEEIEEGIRSLIHGNIAQGKTRAVDLLIRYNLAYFNYARNAVTSHDGSIAFAQIDWSLKSVVVPKQHRLAARPV